MNTERFIASRIAGSQQDKSNISRPIVKTGIIGIAIGIAVMLITVSVVPGFKSEIVKRITGLTTHIAVSSVNVNVGNEQEPIAISPDTLTLIKQLPFVKHVQKTAFKNGLLRTDNENEGILLKGVDKDFDFSFLEESLEEGRLPDFNTAEPSRDVLISRTLAQKMNLKINQKVSVHFISQHNVYDSIYGGMVLKSEPRSRKLTICGIFKTDFADFDEKLSVVDLRQIQRISFWDSLMVGTYEIKLKNFASLEKDLDQIRELLGYNYSANSVKELYANIFIWLDKLDVNGVIIIVLMVLVATINMITALLVLILERTTMIGLLKAMGMNNGAVRRIFLIISLKLTLRGLFWGNLLGIGLCLIQYYYKIAKLDSETYYVDHVAVNINWMNYALLNLGTFAVCCLMLILPTMVISRLSPVKTLKFD